ncbi:AsmA family protein [Sinorhizobium mexicanum]|uniref:AsmA family protein n=1 Tax=Sinorhizobium mexicanum TaxID=375549 RepID=A0A859QGU0_9HYPH|nr:AsmA family protein [Sinorhizobium mexicanum]MBP1886004.1 AsmA protein [Sinorhizobium mexicanum]QLL60660.1 AsmA family protein [Sinorhizobium mexicanum]
MTRQILQILRSSGLWSRIGRRHLVWSAAIGVALAVGYNAALPLVISTTDARATMERMLDAWSGGKSRIDGEPEIRFWPEPELTLPSATIESNEPNPRRLAHIGRITASFSLLAALRGEQELDDIRFVDPVVTIERAADGTVNWKRPHWLNLTKTTTEQDTPFGDITIENGRLRILDQMAEGGLDIDIPAISGTVKWPSFAERISAQLSTTIGGEAIDWALICDQPLALFAGGNASLRTSLTSAPLTFSFEGIANLSMYPFASGHLQASAPSLSALLAWYRGGSSAKLPAGAFSIDAMVATGEKTLKLDELQLAVGGATATGVLDVAFPIGDTPRVEGTLAFDSIDLNGLSFPTVKPADEGAPQWRMAENLTGAWRADVRLSSQEVLVGPLHLTDVAAGVIVNGNRASLDIGDSTYANGVLSGRLVISDKGLEHGGRLQMSLKDADFAAVLESFGLKGPTPSGRGTLTLDLGTDQAVWKTSAADLSGNLTFSLANGSLAGFDAHAFIDLIRRGEFFSLSQASAGVFDFQAAEIDATFGGGVARLNRANFAGPSGSLSVTGVIPNRTGSLALAGMLENTETTNQPLRFFVGGSWPNAVISPLSVLVEPQ